MLKIGKYANSFGSQTRMGIRYKISIENCASE
jgi:hypothetical protein